MRRAIYEDDVIKLLDKGWKSGVYLVASNIHALPSAQPERLTDDDFETIRIHLNAYKEKLCNQKRWEEAEEYQRILEEQPTIETERNEEYNLMVQELLDYEELTKHFYMTTKERGEFQAYVKERLSI